MNRRWSEEDEHRLCELWRAEATPRVIACVLKRTVQACSTRIHLLRNERGIDLPFRNPALAVRK